MTATTSWRDHIKIHPATELLPRMDKRQLAKLAEDIRRNGLLEPITTMCVNDKEMVVDGVNRLDAMASLGWNFLTPKGELCKTIKIKGNKNIHRRHLTSAQKRELVAKLLKLDASKSNRQIAKLIGADHETVAAVRAKGEAGGKIYHLAETKGADGKEYPARKPAKPARPTAAHTSAKIARPIQPIAVTVGPIEDEAQRILKMLDAHDWSKLKDPETFAEALSVHGTRILQSLKRGKSGT